MYVGPQKHNMDNCKPKPHTLKLILMMYEKVMLLADHALSRV